jgi:hypothetical protein
LSGGWCVHGGAGYASSRGLSRPTAGCGGGVELCPAHLIRAFCLAKREDFGHL